jgi:hypothetical protein
MRDIPLPLLPMLGRHHKPIPNEQHEQSTDSRPDQARTLIEPVPTD